MRSVDAKLIIEPHRVNGKLNTEECRVSLKSAGYAVHVRDKIEASEPLIEALPRPR